MEKNQSNTVIPTQAGIQSFIVQICFNILTLDAGLRRHDRGDVLEQKNKIIAMTE